MSVLTGIDMKYLRVLLISFLFLAIVANAAASETEPESEEKGFSISNLWELSKDVCVVSIIFVIAMIIFGSMADSAPYLLKDSVTGVLSHQDNRGAGIGGMIVSVLIFGILILGSIEHNLGVDLMTTIKVCGSVILLLGVLGYFLSRN